jgi:hypothetical protein
MKKKIRIYLLNSQSLFLSALVFVLLIATPKTGWGQGAPGCFEVINPPIVENGACCCSGSISFSIRDFTPPLRYKVFKNDVLMTDWVTVNDPLIEIRDLCDGEYRFKIDDATSCAELCPVFNISGPPCLEVNIENECDWERQGCNGAWTVDGIASGGTPSYTYRWTSDQTGSTVLSPSSRINAAQVGTYRLTVTDANNCVADDYVYLGPLEIIPTITNADCHNPLGEINIETKGGMLNCGLCHLPVLVLKVFRLDPQTGDFLDWEEESLPEVEPDYTSFGINTFNWSSNYPKEYYAWTGKAFKIKKLPPGKYKIRLADDEDGMCQPTLEFEIKMDNPVVSGVVTQSNCNDPCSGSINITATGGKAPYTYTWRKDGQPFSGANGATASGLCEGEYEVVVTGSNGCATTSETFTINPALDINSIEFEDQYCFVTNGQTRVKLKVKQPISTGTGPYTYSWPNSVTDIYYNAVPGSTVPLTITDSRGCSVTLNIQVQICPSPPPGDVTAQVFPNPTLGVFTTRVVVTGSPHEVDIKVTDNMASVIYYENKGILQPGTHDFSIDISSSPAGTYNVIVDWGNISMPIIKQ